MVNKVDLVICLQLVNGANYHRVCADVSLA